MSPFDYLNSINYTKEWLGDEPDFEKDYNSFVINRTLSYTHDSVMWANEANRGIPRAWQYAMLFHALPKRRRFAKWVKPEATLEDVALISEAYKYSNQKAEEVLKYLTSEQIEAIRVILNRGNKTCKK